MSDGTDLSGMNRGGASALARSADLLVAGLAGLLAVPAVLGLDPANPIRVALAIALVTVLPGYGIVSAAFPRRSPGDAIPDRVGGLERLVLSLGLSITLTLLVGIGLATTAIGFRLPPLLAVLVALTLVGTGVAAWRRQSVSRSDRFGVPLARWRQSLRVNTVEAGSLDTALVGLAALGIVALLVSLTFSGPLATAAGLGDRADPSFTEAFLLNPSEDGPVADEYPTSLAPNESATLTVGLGNREGSRQRYTVLVLAQRVENGTVVDSEQLHRFEPTLPAGERWHVDHTIRPVFESDRVRLQYLIYRGDPPADPIVEDAYRELHVWVRVGEP